MLEIVLTPRDPTVFGKCPLCCKKGLGVPLGDINCKAYTVREWKQRPVCENCETVMVYLYEVI